tara:strand:- start:240 stop:1256 length:1017 start_codon:yes stop_codon:yes gene_type:complete
VTEEFDKQRIRFLQQGLSPDEIDALYFEALLVDGEFVADMISTEKYASLQDLVETTVALDASLVDATSSPSYLSSKERIKATILRDFEASRTPAPVVAEDVEVVPLFRRWMPRLIPLASAGVAAVLTFMFVGGNSTTPTVTNEASSVTTVAVAPVESTSVAAGLAGSNTIQSNPVIVPQNVPAAVTTTETNTVQDSSSVGATAVSEVTGDTASNDNSEIAIVPVKPEPTKIEITVDELRAEILFQTVAELRSVLDNGEKVSPELLARITNETTLAAEKLIETPEDINRTEALDYALAATELLNVLGTLEEMTDDVALARGTSRLAIVMAAERLADERP